MRRVNSQIHQTRITVYRDKVIRQFWGNLSSSNSNSEQIKVVPNSLITYKAPKTNHQTKIEKGKESPELFKEASWKLESDIIFRSFSKIFKFRLHNPNEI